MMATTYEQVRAADRRPGYSIVNYREIALPVFRLFPLVTLQEERAIGPIEEFVLRSIDVGVDCPSDIRQFLGLPSIVVDNQLGASVYDGDIEVNDSGDTFRISARGERKLNDLSSSDVSKSVIPTHYDGLTRNIVPVTSDSLYGGREIQTQGLLPIRPRPRRPPHAAELDRNQMNWVLEAVAESTQVRRRVLTVNGLVGKTRMLFRPAVAVAFKSADKKGVSIGVMIDGVLSEEHEDALRELELKYSATALSAIFDSRSRRRDVRAAHKELEKQERTDHSSKDDGHGRPILSVDGTTHSRAANSDRDTVKTLSVYDHPPLLEDALETAQDRLMIVSPWIRANVVDNRFLEKIEERLNNGVSVTIAWGISGRDSQASDRDKNAVDELRNLSGRYDNFLFVHKGHTHAKLLLVDSRYFVTTSFNWLSFRGDPERPFREEEGVYVGRPDRVEAYYKKLMARIRSS